MKMLKAGRLNLKCSCKQKNVNMWCCIVLKWNNYNLLASSVQVAKQLEDTERMKEENENARSRQTELEELLQAEKGEHVMLHTINGTITTY